MALIYSFALLAMFFSPMWKIAFDQAEGAGRASGEPREDRAEAA